MQTYPQLRHARGSRVGALGQSLAKCPAIKNCKQIIVGTNGSCSWYHTFVASSTFNISCRSWLRTFPSLMFFGASKRSLYITLCFQAQKDIPAVATTVSTFTCHLAISHPVSWLSAVVAFYFYSFKCNRILFAAPCAVAHFYSFISNQIRWETLGGTYLHSYDTLSLAGRKVTRHSSDAQHCPLRWRASGI